MTSKVETTALDPATQAALQMHRGHLGSPSIPAPITSSLEAIQKLSKPDYGKIALAGLAATVLSVAGLLGTKKVYDLVCKFTKPQKFFLSALPGLGGLAGGSFVLMKTAEKTEENKRLAEEKRKTVITELTEFLKSVALKLKGLPEISTKAGLIVQLMDRRQVALEKQGFPKEVWKSFVEVLSQIHTYREKFSRSENWASFLTTAS